MTQNLEGLHDQKFSFNKFIFTLNQAGQPQSLPEETLIRTLERFGEGLDMVLPFEPEILRLLNQGRATTERAVPAPRRLVSWNMTRPADLPERERRHLQDLLSFCPHLAILAEHVRAFAELLTDRRGAELEDWMSAVEASDLPALHAFIRGLRKDLPAVVAGLSLPYSNGPAEGVNTKVKLLKRQMYGRAGFALLLVD
jgi:transposase